MCAKAFSSRSLTQCSSSSSCYSRGSSRFRCGWRQVSAEFRRFLDLVQQEVLQDFGRDLLVEADVAVAPSCETTERLSASRAFSCRQEHRRRFQPTPRSRLPVFMKLVIFARRPPSTRTLTVAVRQLQQLRDRGDRAQSVDIVDRGVVLCGVALRDEQRFCLSSCMTAPRARTWISRVRADSRTIICGKTTISLPAAACLHRRLFPGGRSARTQVPPVRSCSVSCWTVSARPPMIVPRRLSIDCPQMR